MAARTETFANDGLYDCVINDIMRIFIVINRISIYQTKI